MQRPFPKDIRPTTSVSKTMEICAAHWLQHHVGQCKYLHGHNYKIDVQITADVKGETGMVMDFSALTAIMNHVFGPWDHALLTPYTPLEVSTFFDLDTSNLLRNFGIFEISRVVPIGKETTAENLCWVGMSGLKEALRHHFSPGSECLIDLKIWETTKAYAQARSSLSSL